jgi:hypothetical protein
MWYNPFSGSARALVWRAGGIKATSLAENAGNSTEKTHDATADDRNAPD